MAAGKYPEIRCGSRSIVPVTGAEVPVFSPPVFAYPTLITSGILKPLLIEATSLNSYVTKCDGSRDACEILSAPMSEQGRQSLRYCVQNGQPSEGAIAGRVGERR